jgi:hypothetical protein
MPADGSEHPDAAALQAIMADTTPEEQVEGFKVRLTHGNRPCCPLDPRQPAPVATVPSAGRVHSRP